MAGSLIFRLTAPLVVLSLLLLGIGVGAALYVHHMQQTVSKGLRVNVANMRAAEEIEILIRKIRTDFDGFWQHGRLRHIQINEQDRHDVNYWLAQAERHDVSSSDDDSPARARRGFAKLLEEVDNLRSLQEGDNLTSRLPQPELDKRVRSLIDNVLVKEIQEPMQRYLDHNEDEVEKSLEANEALAKWLIYGLLSLGICGCGAGLLAGYGIARGISRSLLQLERAERLAAVGQMAAGMAHELRNPLTSMKLLVQSALVQEPGEAAVTLPAESISERDLRILDDEIGRVEALLQSFIEFARPPNLERREANVNDIVEQVVRLVTPRADRSHIKITSDLPSPPLRFLLDTGQFRQVLLNLLLNALDAVSAGGQVGVVLQREQAGGLRLEVSDTGSGLPAELGPRIFAPFVTTKETGLGLGLSTCKRIVEAHDGTIVATDRPEGGAIFTIHLPAAESAADVSAAHS